MPPPTIVPPTFVPRDCPGAPPIRVKINDLARVTYTTGEILRLRSSPEIKNSNIKARLSEGTQIKIFDGPVCSNGFAFWWVRVKSTNTFGWVAEGDSSDYYIEMINRP